MKSLGGIACVENTPRILPLSPTMANPTPKSEEGQFWTNEVLLKVRRLLQSWRWDEVFLPVALADALESAPTHLGWSRFVICKVVCISANHTDLATPTIGDLTYMC